jgi:O-antigen ligase
MQETLTSLVVIIFFIYLSFYILNNLIKEPDFRQNVKSWRFLWLSLTVIAFLIGNYWLFSALSSAIVLFAAKKGNINLVALYIIAIVVLPNLNMNIPGFGGINYFFRLSWPRTVVLCLFLPLLFNRSKYSVDQRFFKFSSDKYVLLYVIFTSALSLRDTSFTEGLRGSIYNLLDIFIPYYAISRNVNSIKEFNTVFYAFFCSILIIALIAVFETVKTWHLYDYLKVSLSSKETKVTSYKFRGGLLRASAAFGSIPLGYVLAVVMGCGFYLFRGRLFQVKVASIFGIMFLALLATVSRGPWVGFFIIAAIYMFLGTRGMTNVFKAGLAGFISIPILLLSPVGDKFIDMLPFIGEKDANTIGYRQRLFEQSLKVIKRNPLFGSTNYLETQEMQSMMQGEGIIDVVNTFLQIALEYGITGVCLFILVFVSLLWRIYKIRLKAKKIPQLDGNVFYMSNLFISVLIGILAMIATVSGRGHGIISIIYWVFAALAAAYVRLGRRMILETKVGA